MPNNLHISYDLINPGQNYEKVIARIKLLGDWAKIHQSYWFVSSTKTPEEAVNFIGVALDQNDKVYVVDAVSNSSAWNRLPNDVREFIIDNWS